MGLQRVRHDWATKHIINLQYCVRFRFLAKWFIYVYKTINIYTYVYKYIYIHTQTQSIYIMHLYLPDPGTESLSLVSLALVGWFLIIMPVPPGMPYT